MVSAPKEITFIKIYRSSKFSIHKISNTKHLSYTLRRGCLKTLAKLAHIMSSRLMPFWATYYTFITSSKSYLVQPFWLSLSLLDQRHIGAHVHQREEFWRVKNKVHITSKRESPNWVDDFLFRLPPIELPPLSSAPLKKTPDEKAGEELDFNFLR